MVNVDDSQVPESLKTSSEYLSYRRAIVRVFETPEETEILRNHEAGHLIYFTGLGLKCDFQGPFISYDEKLGWRYGAACVLPVGLLQGMLLEEDDDYHAGVARCAAAGGVFSEVLSGLPELKNGSITDSELFFRHCSSALPFSNSISVKALWDRARNEVRSDLKNGMITVDQIRQAKEEISRRCIEPYYRKE